MSATRQELRPGDTYTCARCGGTFVTDWTSGEALAEACGSFTESEASAPQEIICDDCYEEFMTWYRQALNA